MATEATKKRGPAPIAIIALALLGVGSCFGGLTPHLDPLFISHPVHVTGRVVELRPVPKGGLRPVVAFSAEGQRVRFEPKWSSAFSPVGIGDDVEVTYAEGDPSLAAIALPFGLFNVLFLIAGSVMEFMATVLALRRHRKGSR
jgi:hypothetical protein